MKIADNFVDRSVVKALNRCRNLSHDPSGPYCYAISTSHAIDVTKQFCPIRICRSSGIYIDIINVLINNLHSNLFHLFLIKIYIILTKLQMQVDPLYVIYKLRLKIMLLITPLQLLFFKGIPGPLFYHF